MKFNEPFPVGSHLVNRNPWKAKMIIEEMLKKEVTYERQDQTKKYFECLNTVLACKICT